MPWVKDNRGQRYDNELIYCAEAFARTVLRILHEGGIISEMPSPMDEVQPASVLRLLQEITKKIDVVVDLADVYSIRPSCFAPDAHLPNILRYARGREFCPFEDDRSKCKICICDSSPRIHGLHSKSSAILWDKSYPSTVAIHNGERIESQGEESVGIQGNCPDTAEFASTR
jgi:hypothetical protein